MAEAMSVDAAAGAAASAVGDDDLVHFLVTNTDGKGLPSFRLAIPKKHLESLPSSYLSAMSSERWVGNSTDRGTTVSPFTVSVDDCPPGIRKLWDKYCHRAPDLVPFVQKAYANAVSNEDEMMLPYGMDLEGADHFLRYYGLIPPNKDGADFLRVPEHGPAAVYLRSKLYPVEAKRIKTIRDYVVRCIANNPERTTYFVFDACSSNKNFIQRNNAVPGASVVSSGEGMGDGTFMYDLVANSKFRDKLVHHLTEEDKLEAEFVTEPFLLAKLGEKAAPDGKRDQQTLVAVNEETPDDLGEEIIRYWTDEDYEVWDEEDHRILRWRHVLKVQIPDA